MTANRLSPAALLGLAIALPALLMTLDLVFARQLAPLGPAFDIALSGLVAVLALTFACLHWRRLDEAGRTAHRFAWFWGSTWGLLAVWAVLIVVLAIPSVRASVDQSATAALDDFVARAHHRFGAVSLAFAAGVTAAAVAQALGHLVTWAYWWVGRRSK